jgi:hypothetical protein
MHVHTHPLPWPVQQRKGTHPLPAARCTECTGTSCPAPSRRRNSTKQTQDCSSSPPQIGGSLGSLAIPAGSALIDACNGFNKLNPYLMLWNVDHRWNQVSRFAFNWYRHWVGCLVWSEPGEPAFVIHLKEGITQGDCLAMSLYIVALMPLASKMHEEFPEALQPWYCDNAGTAGKILPNAQCLDFLVKSAHHMATSPSPASHTIFARQRMNPLHARLLRALALRSNTRDGSGTWVASLGAPSGRRSGWGSWSANG